MAARVALANVVRAEMASNGRPPTLSISKSKYLHPTDIKFCVIDFGDKISERVGTDCYRLCGGAPTQT
jgi:hypothetical protein